VTVTDKAGNATEISQEVTIQGAAAVTRQTTVNGKIANDDVINAVEANRVEVSGTAEPNSNIRVLVPGSSSKVANTAHAGADGFWKTTLNFTAEPDGPKTIEATATLPGSTSTSVGTHTVTLAKTPPAKPTNLQFDGHASKVITAAEAVDGVTVTGDVAPGSKVQVQLGTTIRPADVDAAGHFSATLPAPAVTPGGKQPYSVTVTVADAAGNTPQSWAEQIEVQGPAEHAEASAWNPEHGLAWDPRKEPDECGPHEPTQGESGANSHDVPEACEAGEDDASAPVGETSEEKAEDAIDTRERLHETYSDNKYEEA